MSTLLALPSNSKLIDKTLAFRTAVVFSLLIAVFVLCLLLNSLLNNAVMQYNAEQSMVANARQRLFSLQNKAKEFDSSYELWKKLSTDFKKASGLQISEAQRLFEEAKHSFNVGRLEVNLSAPEEVKTQMHNERVMLVSSHVSASFDAMIDEEALRFVEMILHNIPGFVRIRSVQLSRNGDITNKFLQDIQQGKLESLVKTEIQFDWYDLKNVSKNN